jgi:hypothetical protein
LLHRTSLLSQTYPGAAIWDAIKNQKDRIT